MKESKEPSKPRIAMIGSDWSQNEYRRVNNKPGAISMYRLIYPQKHLAEWFDVDYFGADLPKMAEGKEPAMFWYELLSDYDMVICKVVDNPQSASALRFMTKYLGIPLVIDIDDNIWELKPDQPGYKHYHKGSSTLGVASGNISLADAVFSSTKPLGDYIKARLKKAYNENMDVYVLPNCVDIADYQFKPAKKDPKKIIIGWQGSTTHHEDLKIAMPAIGKLMQEYSNIYLELLGGVENSLVADLFANMPDSILDRVKTKPGVPAFDTFPHLLSEQAWDIAIAPLTDEVFNHAKSHIKWMEYAMYEIPCVASKVYPYYKPIQGTETIEHGVTGLLSKNDEWYTNLKLLIDNEDKRKEIGRNAKNYVSEAWHIKNHVYKWKDAIDKVLKKGE